MNDFIRTRLNKKRKILIVDDEEINRLLLSNILEKDYDILLASNGLEALEVARSEQDILSLILLDLLMPVMDGYEFYNKIKDDPVLGKVPVVVLTSEKDAEVKSLNMGVADFIPKPYDVPEVITARISRIIQLYEDKNIIKATQFDELTDLFNREYFHKYTAIVDQYYPEHSKDMIAININRFHVINAIRGRKFGDEVLSAVGKSIKEYANTYRGIAGRLSADCFFLYVKSEDHAERLLGFIGNALKGMLDDFDTRVRIGIYKNASENPDYEKRVEYSLLACNSIKGNFNQRYTYYDEEISNKEHFEERLIQDLDKALESGQFKVYFQPKYEVQGEKPHLCSAEALIRWIHPELGFISPGKFIPLFENNGLISKVDRYVWSEVATKIAYWKTKYHKIVPVSVNVSRVDMLNKRLPEEMKSIIDQAGIDSHEYYLEVTESAYTDNQNDVLAIVDKLREYGFAIEMDDFGTGYSSLNMLTKLPFDVLKLDMAFVRNIHTDEKAHKLVEFIMGIAKYLNVRVIAEGVEYKEQYELLKDLGCDVIQGYYFSKPLPEEEFEAHFKKEYGYDD